MVEWDPALLTLRLGVIPGHLPTLARSSGPAGMHSRGTAPSTLVPHAAAGKPRVYPPLGTVCLLAKACLDAGPMPPP